MVFAGWENSRVNNFRANTILTKWQIWTLRNRNILERRWHTVYNRVSLLFNRVSLPKPWARSRNSLASGNVSTKMTAFTETGVTEPIPERDVKGSASSASYEPTKATSFSAEWSLKRLQGSPLAPRELCLSLQLSSTRLTDSNSTVIECFLFLFSFFFRTLHLAQGCS